MSAIYPIGFSAGTYRSGAEPARSLIRVGRVLHSIGVVDLDLWTAAHAEAPDAAAGRTRIDILAAYRDQLILRDAQTHESEMLDGDADALPTAAEVDNTVSDAALDRLLDAGLLVEVAGRIDAGGAPDGIGFVVGMTQRQFAETHRFRGLLEALGQTLDNPGRERVGTSTHVIELEQALFGLWQIAGQAESVLAAAEQLLENADEFSDVLSIEECLERLLPDLDFLVAQGLGYFDVVPHTEGPLAYVTFEHMPLDESLIEAIDELSGNRLLSEAEYRSRLSGAPEGLMYLVEDPNSGEDVAYAGFVSGALFDTIASMSGRSAASMINRAHRQLAAAGQYPLVWHVQQSDDVESVRRILRDAGITRIEVRHTPDRGDPWRGTQR